jgi:hypothetical protein
MPQRSWNLEKDKVSAEIAKYAAVLELEDASHARILGFSMLK